MTTPHHARQKTSGRRRPRSLDIAMATALSVGLLGGTATVAHAEESSPTRVVTAGPAAGPEQFGRATGASASGRDLETQQTAPTARVIPPVEHPGLTGRLTGTLESEEGDAVTLDTWVRWKSDLTNTGDVPLTMDGVVIAPGETFHDYDGWRIRVTQADLDTGTIRFATTYTGTTPRGADVTSSDVSGSLAIPRPAEKPALTGHFRGYFEHSVDPVRVGTWITWTTDLANTGDVALTRINDTGIDLLPGQTAAPYKFRMQVTQADLDAGTISVSRTFTATTPRGAHYTAPAVTGSLTVPTGPTAG